MPNHDPSQRSTSIVCHDLISVTLITGAQIKAATPFTQKITETDQFEQEERETTEQEIARKASFPDSPLFLCYLLF